MPSPAPRRVSPPAAALTPAGAWTLMLRARERLASRGSITAPIGVQLGPCGELVETAPEDGAFAFDPENASGWTARPTVHPTVAAVLDLYAPLLIGPLGPQLIVGHLAQSLDGRVALGSGASQFISGEADLVHTHRLRALFDAVIVGAHTVEHDNPRLTTRLADGPNPTRVILDPRGSLPAARRVFADGAAPTVIVHAAGARPPASDAATRSVAVEAVDGWMPIGAVVDALADLGLRRLFVEGGGITVSGFVEAQLMDRLHITVAPVLLGSGRPAIALPEIPTLQDATRLSCRHLPLPPDMLFDCPLSR